MWPFVSTWDDTVSTRRRGRPQRGVSTGSWFEPDDEELLRDME